MARSNARIKNERSQALKHEARIHRQPHYPRTTDYCTVYKQWDATIHKWRTLCAHGELDTQAGQSGPAERICHIAWRNLGDSNGPKSLMSGNSRNSSRRHPLDRCSPVCPLHRPRIYGKATRLSKKAWVVHTCLFAAHGTDFTPFTTT